MSFLFGGRKSTSAPDQAAVPRFSSTGPDGGSSLELIRYDTTTGKFSLGDEALKVLKQTRGPVGVVAVAGRARQGKSFILNQLLGHSGGFKVAATHRPCTKGLWMWSAPVELQGADGSKYNLVLLDTEGIDAYDQTAQYSTQIFSLAVLLSSLFVYNQLGPIDEAALDRLSLVTEMTKNIRVRASSGAAEDASELAAFTPAFIWLLRDFYLKLEEDGVAVSPRDYLEAALQAHAGSGPAVAAKNQVGAQNYTPQLKPILSIIKQSISNVSCVLMFHYRSATASRPCFLTGTASPSSVQSMMKTLWPGSTPSPPLPCALNSKTGCPVSPAWCFPKPSPRGLEHRC